MTQRDYVLIARVIMLCRPDMDQADLNLLVLNMSKELKADNPNFKPHLFIKACGADESVLLAL